MRFDARILLGLLGCWINLSTADDTSSNDGSTGTLSSPSPVVSLANALETPPTFFATQDMTFFFETTNAAVTTINLKLFDPATPEGDSTIGTGMVGLAVAPGGSSTGTGGTGGPVKAADAGVARLQSRAPLSLEGTWMGHCWLRDTRMIELTIISLISYGKVCGNPMVQHVSGDGNLQ